MAITARKPSPDDPVDFTIRMTPAQFTEIHRRASLGAFDPLARSEYLVGCIFGEPHDALLERVHKIRDVERARLRAKHEQADRQRAERVQQPSAR